MNKRGNRRVFCLRKRGQTTVFIIIGILIVVGVVLFFILTGDEESDTGYSEISADNPSGFLKTCVKDNVRTTIRELSYQGGYLKNPLNISYQFRGESFHDISYLCYTSGNYKTCNVVQPLLISHLEKEIENKFKERRLIEKCWDSLIDNYEAGGWDVEGEYDGWEANLIEDNLIIKLKEVDLSLERVNESKDIDEVQAEFNTKLYNNAFIASEIADQQSRYGSFDETGYMALYPEADIDRTLAPGKTKIYTIENKQTKEKFRFAVRSLVSPSEI